MDLLAAWLLFPLALLTISAGAGLLTEWMGGVRFAGALVAPAGLATVMVVARLATSTPQTARLALPVLLVLALSGLVVGWARLRRAREFGWVASAALATFVVFGAPVFLTGEPTFAGYTLLGDTSHQLVLADLYSRQGPDWEALPLSSARASMGTYVATGYPVGAQAALGALAPLGVVDLVWLYQPFMTFIAALTACSLFALVLPHVRRRSVAALIAFIAASPALVVSFALQGSIKELAALLMIVLTVALGTAWLRERWAARGLLPLAISAVAGFTALGPAVGPYLGLILIAPAAALVARLLRSTRRRREFAWAAGVAGISSVLAAPVLGSAVTAYRVATGVLSTPAASTGPGRDLGHLAAPLSKTQALGVWLNGDFRYVPVAHANLSFVLAGIAAGAAVLGLIWAVRRRATGPLLLLGATALASAYLLRLGNPYADAKVLMLLSPALVLMSMLGAVSLYEARRRVEGALLFSALAGGVLASNALAYHDVQPAPYERYSELLEIDKRLAGAGPAIYTDWDEFGKYFLRTTPGYNQPEWLHIYTPPDDPTPPPATLPALSSPAIAAAVAHPKVHPNIKTPVDLDELRSDYVQSVPALVMRRSPISSRPPSNYRRSFVGRYYEVWQREPDSEGTVRAHLPLGNEVLQPAAVPSCRAVLRLGRQARSRGARLAFVARPRPAIFTPLSAARRPPWPSYSEYPGTLVPDGPGRVEGTFDVPQGGEYKVWIEGSFGRNIEVAVDGRVVGSIAYELSPPGYYFDLGSSSLTAGSHQLSILRGGGDLRPGNGGSQGSLRRLGPVVFSSAHNDRLAVQEAAPHRARQLCGRRLDWIEVVASPAGPGSAG